MERVLANSKIGSDRRQTQPICFVFDRERNVYVCPAGKLLTNNGLIGQGRILPYRASMYDCGRCELKPRCTTATLAKSRAISTRTCENTFRQGQR
jgi:hypothetical protein